MHSAPWTNISSSIGDCAAIFSISFLESSLGSTARQKPMSASIFIPSRVCTEVCVEACRGISGAALRISEVSPISCKISASALTSQAHLTAFIAVSISSSRTRVLSVIYTLTPRAWQYSTACASSSLLKFAALRRAFSSRPPRYTASAPQRTAAVSESNEPAGASISGLFIMRAVLLLVCGELFCKPVRLAHGYLAVGLGARRVLEILLYL